MAKCICEWEGGCGGAGVLHCSGCGGDLCVCACGGEMDCDGCEDCDFGDDAGDIFGDVDDADGGGP